MRERYGHSKLADVLEDGIDPHSYTAAMFAGDRLEKFLERPDAKQLRQQAKAINFGFPGGLGASSLVTYAKQSYGVEITPEEAKQFRDRLTEEVYPELKKYLSEDSASVLADTLDASVQKVRAAFPEEYHFAMLKKIAEGRPIKANGTRYRQTTIDSMWNKLAGLNKNPALKEAISRRDVSETSPLRKLMFSSVATPTGRLRGAVSFTAARNTPFQGLAADGAKLAMWELLKAGYRTVAFVHDEFIVELARSDDVTEAAIRIQTICCQAMQSLVGDIPVKCEYALVERWYKQAEAVFKDGRLQEWRPQWLQG